MLLNLAHPRLHCSETLSVGNIVGDNDSMSSLVVAGSDSFESLLAGGVPDLKLDSLSVHIDGANLEVDTDGGHKVFSKDVILKRGIST